MDDFLAEPPTVQLIDQHGTQIAEHAWPIVPRVGEVIRLWPGVAPAQPAEDDPAAYRVLDVSYDAFPVGEEDDETPCMRLLVEVVVEPVPATTRVARARPTLVR